jgi:hypothetical protein
MSTIGRCLYWYLRYTATATIATATAIAQVAARESAVLKVSKEREALLQKDHERETTIDNLVDEYTKVLHIL